MSADLFRRKSLAASAAQASSGHLSRTLGPVSIVAIGVGAIIGAGIFVLTGTAAARHAGPAIVLSFALAGVACALVALCYAELSAMLPVSGSTYAFTYAALGELPAWVIGWDLMLEYMMGAATVAVGWSFYAKSLLGTLGIALPPAWTEPVNWPAVAIVAVLSAALVLGTQGSARLNNLMVAVKLLVIAAFLVVGVFHVDPANWHPFLPANTGEFGAFGASGLLRGAGVVFFAYIGFDTVSTTAQEARNPQRDVPFGVVGSLVICTLLYIAVAAVLTGLVPYRELDVADPIARGVAVLGLPWLSALIAAGALAGLTTVVLVLLYAQGRIFHAMASDGLLPPLFARVHPRLRTPWLSQALIGCAVAVLAGLVPVHLLGEMVSIGTLFAFMLVCGAVLHLRRTAPNAPRPFRLRGAPAVPLLGILACLVLMVGLPGVTWLRLLAWLVVGLLVYAGYGRRHALARGG